MTNYQLWTLIGFIMFAGQGYGIAVLGLLILVITSICYLFKRYLNK